VQDDRFSVQRTKQKLLLLLLPGAPRAVPVRRRSLLGWRLPQAATTAPAAACPRGRLRARPAPRTLPSRGRRRLWRRRRAAAAPLQPRPLGTDVLVDTTADRLQEA